MPSRSGSAARLPLPRAAASSAGRVRTEAGRRARPTSGASPPRAVFSAIRKGCAGGDASPCSPPRPSLRKKPVTLGARGECLREAPVRVFQRCDARRELGVVSQRGLRRDPARRRTAVRLGEHDIEGDRGGPGVAQLLGQLGQPGGAARATGRSARGSPRRGRRCARRRPGTAAAPSAGAGRTSGAAVRRRSVPRSRARRARTTRTAQGMATPGA